MKKIILLVLLTSLGIQVPVIACTPDEIRRMDKELIKRHTLRNGTNSLIPTRPRKSALKNNSTQNNNNKSVAFKDKPTINYIDTSYDDDNFESQMQQLQKPSIMQLLWHFITENKWKIGSSIVGLCLLGYLFKKMRSK